MSYSVEKLSSNQVKISFEVPAQTFDDAVQKVYLQNRGKFNVQGFRKGRAPRKLIEKMYGEGVFYEDSLDVIFPDVYTQVLEESDFNPVAQPAIESIDQMGAGQDLRFAITVYVQPDVELGAYKGLKVTHYNYTATEEEIDKRIAMDVEKTTTTQEVSDRPVQVGDTVQLDYAGSVDGVPFEGGTATAQTLVIGSNSFIPGFEDQMVGMNLGEEKDLNVTFPEQYHAPELQAKEAVFHVKVNLIEESVKPELDDEFAQDVSEFDTFEAYKEAIIKELTENGQKQADNDYENEIVQAIVDSSDCDIPAPMIDTEIQTMIRETKTRFLRQGIRYEDFLKYTGQTEEQVTETFRPQAENRIKTQLVIQAIIKAENIEVSEEEVQKSIEDEASRAGREVEEFKASLNERQMEYFEENAKILKSIEIMKANAVVTEKDSASKIDVAQTLSDVVEATEAVEAPTAE